MRTLRGERGGILALSALIIPGFLLITALVLDTGIWFTHKRSLQNRADSGALAAGVEYLSQLSNCAANPTGPAATAIADKARLYAGATGTGYNETVNNQSEITVKINATGPTAADDSDGGNPCQDHAPDGISPNGGIWTDVIARETNLRTVAGTFGINLPSMAARARVELSQITGIRAGGLPFVHETGDYVDCVWARFIDVETGNLVSLIGRSNPVLLTLDPTTPRRWTADVNGINLPNGDDDIGVEYWMGSKEAGACDFSTDLKSQLPATGPLDKFGDGTLVPIDWINVYDDDTPSGGAPPLMHHFRLSPGSCGPEQVGFVNSTVACDITYSAEVDHGSNPAPSKITVSSSNPAVAPVDAPPGGSAGTETTYAHVIPFDPNEVTGSTTRSQDYTQVGQHKLKASWTMTSGTLTSGVIDKSGGGTRTCSGTKPCVCTTGSPCSAEFKTEQAGNWLHATYVSDPLLSTPLRTAELMTGGTPMPNSIAADGGPVGPFKIVVTNVGVDQDHIVLIRGAVQGTGNKTLAIKCGWKSNSASALSDAIANGCPAAVTQNQRGDSCNPEPPLTPGGPWDCVEATPGNKTGPVSSGNAERFASPCTPNNWNGGSPTNLNAADPRFAYIFLSSFGRVTTTRDWYPIKAFLRVYVTGGDGIGCPGDDLAPRGFNDKGAQLWGHLVDIVTLDGNAMTGSDKCDLTLSVLNCKPALVR